MRLDPGDGGWVRRLGWALVSLVTTGLVLVIWVMASWNQAPWQAGPDRLSICGRDFKGPGYTYSQSQLRREGGVRLGTVRTWQGKREVWGRPQTIGGVAGCGTGVYLRTGSETFRGYALLGGP